MSTFVEGAFMEKWFQTLIVFACETQHIYLVIVWKGLSADHECVGCRRGAEKAPIELVRPFGGERGYRKLWSCMSRESIKAFESCMAWILPRITTTPNKTKQPFYTLLLWASHPSCMVKLIANILFSFQWMLFSFVLSGFFSCLEVFSSQFCPVHSWFP